MKSLRRVTQSYAEGKGLRTSILSGFYARITQVTQSSILPHMCAARRLAHNESTLYPVRNLRNTHPVRTLAALTLSALALCYAPLFFCITTKKRFVTDSKYLKKEASLKGVLS